MCEACLSFLVYLAMVLVFTLLVSWGLFRYFSAEQVNPAPASPFAGTRQLPSGPQLQVNPRQDYLKFHEDQEQSLESYAWENRAAGTVRVPIDRAMELLLQKGIPVAGETSNAAAGQARTERGHETMRAKTKASACIAAMALIALPLLAQQASTARLS